MSIDRSFLFLLVVSLLFVTSAALVVESENENENVLSFAEQQWAPLVESLDQAMAEERAGLALVELEEKIHNYFATTPAAKASTGSKKTPAKPANALKATKPANAAKKSSSKSAKPAAASKKRATKRPAAERLSSDEQKAKWARFKAANPKKRYQSAAAEQRAFAQFCANRAKIVANNDAVGNELNPTPFKSSGPLADVAPEEFKSKFLRSRRGSEQGTRLPSREADAATKRLGALPKAVATPAKAAAKTKQTNAKSSNTKKSSTPKTTKPTAARQARFMQVESETEVEAELDAEAEIDSEQEAESDLEAAVDDQAEAEADQTAEADADILAEMGADMEIGAEMEGESEWEPAGEIDFRIDEDESHSTLNLVEVSADAVMSGTPQGRVVGASGTVAGASGTVAGASGTVAGASGTVAGASGTVAGASGTVAGASGTVAGASGTVAGASGTVAGASGTVAGASGTVAGASGTVAGASGTTAGHRVIVAPAQAIELQKFQPFKGPVILNPADKTAEQRICRAVTTVWFRRYAHTPAQKLWQFGVKLFNGGASKFLDDPMKLCVTDWARVIGQGLHPEQRYIQSAYAELVERPSNTHFVNPYVATNDEPRDQSQCGSCWAQAAIGSYEAALKKVNQYKGPLSIQHVLDCATGKDALGCHGGTPQAALSFLSKNPPVLEADYPYTGVTSKCQTNKKGLLNLKKTSGWAFATKSCTKGKCEDQFGYETELLFAVKKDGPFIAYVDASSWQYYGGGIFPHAKCSSTSDAGNHVVQLLGYGQEAGVPYWLIKNSWGSNWGENGYIRLPMGVNACGIANFVGRAALN